MKTTSRLLISCSIALLAAASHAGMATDQTDGWHITNGGTGYIGLTQSAGQPRAMQPTMGMAAGEASTMVAGQPNANPDAPARGDMARNAELRTMGNAAYRAGPADARSAAARNPSWGTPD